MVHRIAGLIVAIDVIQLKCDVGMRFIAQAVGNIGAFFGGIQTKIGRYLFLCVQLFVLYERIDRGLRSWLEE